MTATRETKIRKALLDKVVNVASTLSLPISMPSMVFEPNVKSPFLIVAYIPNTVSRNYMGTEEAHEYIGLIQIDVMMPIMAGSDADARSNQIAGLCIEEMHEDSKYEFDGVTVNLTNRGSVAPSYRDNGMWRTPVRFSWRCSV